MTKCEDCGATHAEPGVDCSTRFDALLALDHSRREPWGSRHGLAFSAFALQHPGAYDRNVLERAWLMLHAVYVRGADREDVTRALRRSGGNTPAWDAPPLPSGPPRRPFATTIADLGTFAAESYAARLDDWCQAALGGWPTGAASQP